MPASLTTAPGALTRDDLSRLLAVGIELVALALLVLAPWCLGAGEPVFELLLDGGLWVLLLLWSARILADGAFVLKSCAATSCLVALFLLAVFQLVPLPKAVLGWLSPATVAIYDQFLPAVPEKVIGSEDDGPPVPTPGTTLSLYPGATGRAAWRMLAIVLFFIVLRQNLTPSASLRRLCWAILLNGFALALFGFIQRLTTRGDGIVYWSIPIQGHAFGPFLYRNYFTGYMNLCIGLGVGLLMSRQSRVAGASTLDPTAAHPTETAMTPATWRSIDSRHWIAGALVLMIAASIYSQSRGGILALGVAGLVLLLWTVRLHWRWSLLAVAGITLLVFGLLSWTGFDWSRARLQSILDGRFLDGENNGRTIIWERVLPLLRQFPLFGTGFGTFAYVEQPFQTSERYHVVDWAHNEYLQTLIEGGFIGLALAGFAIFFVCRHGWDALRSDQPSRGIYIGALFALGALGLHGTFDFLLHLPAILLLTVAIAANLCCAADPARQTNHADEVLPSAYDPSPICCLQGPMSLAAPIAILLLGSVLVAESHSAFAAQRLLLASALRDSNGKLPTDQTRIALLSEAVALQPRSARLRTLLADAHLEMHQAHCRERWSRQQAIDTISLALSVPGNRGPLLAIPIMLTARAIAKEMPLSPGGREVGDEGDLAILPSRTREANPPTRAAPSHRAEALSHYLAARNLCPLLARPHVRLAAGHDQLADAEPHAVYLQCARRLVPADAELWYLGGVQELKDGHLSAACQSWRRTLELSERFLPSILALGSRHFDSQLWTLEVLPERPALLRRAAYLLYPAPRQAEERAPLLDAALNLLARPPEQLTNEEVHLAGQLQADLGRGQEAVTLYRTVMEREPRRLEWRLEMAQLLLEQHRLREAKLEVQTILHQEPANRRGRDLLKEVNLRMWER